jgi:NADPH:quinone reductase-like Zn-dependent oxidoreductase
VKAAIVENAGQVPVYGDFADPAPIAGTRLLRVTAASISQLARSRAAGTHYTSDGAFPFIPGIDGVGTTEDGQRVYFLLPDKPYGSMAEWCVVDDRRRLTIPDALSDVEAAAMAIPGMSSWAALLERAHLQAGETVLINGATGASGRLAIQIARHLGARKVIATGRRADTFDELRRLGADVTIQLTQDRETLEAVFSGEFAQRIDIVLDYLWGTSAETLIVAAAKAGPEGIPIRYIQIGSIGGAQVSVPGAALRSSALQLMGSGIGSVPWPRLLHAIQNVLNAAPSIGFTIATQTIPLADVTSAWTAPDSDARIVLRP